jgi:hypothetical protein
MARLTRRRTLWIALAVVVILVTARGLLLMAPGVRFDADQGVVGLMAKHISAGRAFPLFFYGQSYLPALEAYLAAPVMWLLGPTEVALKLPVVAMNVTALALLVWLVSRDLGLTPLLALAGVLPLVVPPLIPGTRFMEAMGGNVEPLLATVLLWLTRDRRWLFGVVAAVALALREIAAFPIAALLVLDVLHGGWRQRATVERWAIALVLAVTVSATIDSMRPHAAMFGPGTTARIADLDISGSEALMTQVCVIPSRWPERASLLAQEHLPMMIGAYEGPAAEFGLSTGIAHGSTGLGVWVLALMLASGVAALLAPRGQTSPAAAGVPRGLPGPALPWFLVLCGVASTLAYWLVACSQITYNSLRYNLLVTLVPVGVLLAGLRWQQREVRAALVAAALVWCGANLADYGALADEIASGRWPDHRGELVRKLEAKGLRELWGEFRLAYVVSFRSAERVVVAPTNIHRIDEYARRAAAANAQMLRTRECGGGTGELMVPGIWLCPPPAPEELPIY